MKLAEFHLSEEERTNSVCVNKSFVVKWLKKTLKNSLTDGFMFEIKLKFVTLPFMN